MNEGDRPEVADVLPFCRGADYPDRLPKLVDADKSAAAMVPGFNTRAVQADQGDSSLGEKLSHRTIALTKFFLRDSIVQTSPWLHPVFAVKRKRKVQRSIPERYLLPRAEKEVVVSRNQ